MYGSVGYVTHFIFWYITKFITTAYGMVQYLDVNNVARLSIETN